MFGPKIKNVFKSRWNAVFWSASVLLTAYCSVPSRDKTEHEQQQKEAAAQHYNPWAKTK